MSILYQANDPLTWNEFYSRKLEKGNVSKRELSGLLEFIENEEYSEVAACLFSRPFSHPRISEINKKGSSKKRAVFTFPRKENYLLKLIVHLLYRYDGIFPDNLYSFRQNVSVKDAIRRIANWGQLKSSYCYKVDIHDYFNSVDTEIMSDIIRKRIDSLDHPLSELLIKLISDPFAIKNGVITKCKKGVMAGMPVSGFLADLYLIELDEWFASRGIMYLRYSDDIVVFAESSEKIDLYEKTIKDFLQSKHLEVNPKKEVRTLPGEPVEFLGFRFEGNDITISRISVEKLKDKIRRKARALYRWRIKRSLSPDKAIRGLIKHFNRKFYNNPIHNEMTWCRWYFPVITTDKALMEIDRYMIQYIRYIPTGRHSKINYRLRYDKIKALGYVSLVNSYYKYKNQ